MTIIRGPQPRENFQILPNATARDKRLSFRARGLLAFMLSYPENWNFNRDWIAAQTDGEGVTAVRTALQELEKAGYLYRRRVQVNGRFEWVQKIYRTPQGGLADQTTGGFPADEISADGNQPSTEELMTNNGEEDEMRCSPSGRGASETFTGSWRDEDRALFRSHVGDKVYSDGSRWTEGTFSADVLYDAFHKQRKHRWPGRRLDAIAMGGGNTTGLESWLIEEGLEPA